MRSPDEAWAAARDEHPFSNGTEQTTCRCGCGGRPQAGRRYISGHNSRLRGVSFETRFWEKVDTSGDCWLWTASLGNNGYGQVRGPDGRTWRAHRASYWLVHGELPESLQLDHLCRNRQCVRPDHLEPVTQTINILRGQGPSAQNARADVCVNGHTYDDENTGWRADGKGRYCKQCARDTGGDRYVRWRAKQPKTTSGTIRSWAMANGYQVAPTGNVPLMIVRAYESAMAGTL